MDQITSVTIRYLIVREGFTVNVSETYRPRPKKKREPKEEAPRPKKRPER